MAMVGRIKFGSEGLEVSAQGLGCKDLNAPGNPEPDMIALVHPTPPIFYGQNANEILLRKALKGDVGQKAELASKFGLNSANRKVDIRGDPAYVRAACEASLTRLDVRCLDLNYQHGVDNRVPIEVTH